MLEIADIPRQSFNGVGERLIVLDKDYLGRKRGKKVSPGPLELEKEEVVTIRVF